MNLLQKKRYSLKLKLKDYKNTQDAVKEDWNAGSKKRCYQGEGEKEGEKDGQTDI